MAGDRAHYGIEVGLLGLAVALAYANSFTGVFQFDDYYAIVDNPVVHSWSAWWSDLLRGGIRPLLKLTYLINYASGGLFGFHLFNVSLHLGNTVLVYLLSRIFVSTKLEPSPLQRFLPLLTALVFAVHPMQVEAVTYITGRSSSLMSFFYLGSLLCFQRGRVTNRWLLTYLAGPLLFLLAFATKETSISLPVALLLFDVAVRRAPFTARRVLDHLVYWLLASAFMLVAITHPGYRRLLVQSISSTTLYEGLLTQIHGVCYLLLHAVLPISLTIDPDLSVIRTLSFPVAVEMVFIVGGLICGLAALWRHPHLGFGILWFLFHTFVVYTLAARTDVINERHLYLGSWGLCLLFAMALARPFRGWQKGSKVLWASACCIVLLLTGTTIARNQVYTSEILLWQDTVKKSPGKARVHNNLGYAYYLSGDREKAREAFAKALQLNPGWVVSRNNLILLDAGLQSLTPSTLHRPPPSSP
jgi:protein O-mannosyl-transferase